MGAKIGTALGQRIKELREGAHLTQADLARLVRKSVETISNFERGKTIPSVRTLVALAHHIDCDIADFFKKTDVKRTERDPAATNIQNKFRMLDVRDRQLLADFAELLANRDRRG